MQKIHSEGHSISNKESKVFKEIIECNLDKTDEEFSKVFLKQQLQVLKTKNKRCRRWHPSIIKWCLYIHNKSPSAYECLRKTNALELSCNKTL